MAFSTIYFGYVEHACLESSNFLKAKKKQRGRSKCIGICRMNKNSKWEAAENLFCSRYRHDSHVYFAFWFFVYTF